MNFETFTVYRLTNKKTKRHYYGRAGDPQTRLRNHLYELDKGLHYNKAMQADHEGAKYAFKIIKSDMTQKDANRLSDQLAKDDPTCYNKLGVVPSNRRGKTYKLSSADVEEIRRLYFTQNIAQRDLATRYGVTQGNISLVVNGLVHNLDSSYKRPTGLPPGSVWSKGALLRFDLRKLYTRLIKKHSEKDAIYAVAKKFELTPETARHWIFNEPAVRSFESRNLNHAGASKKQCVIDGKTYQSPTWFLTHKGSPLTRLVLVGDREYQTIENRTIFVDGEEFKQGTENIYKFLKRINKWPAVKTGPRHYELFDASKHAPEERLKNAYKAGRARSEACKEQMEARRQRWLAALKDPVLKKNGTINVHATQIKHGIRKPKTRAAKPAGS